MDLNPDRTTGPNHGTKDNDKRFTPRVNVGTVPVGIWSDSTGTVWITVPDNPKIDSYNMLPSSASSTTLSGLTVNDGSSNTKLRPAFASTTLSYRTSVTAFINRVTVNATPSGGNTATVTYVNSNGAPLEDADSSTGGFQLDISTGETPLHILVTGQDGSALIHKAVVERDSSQPGGWTPTQDVYNLDPVAVHYPKGIWSDGTTMWLTNTAASTVFAYTMTTSTRDTSKEFSLDTENSDPKGIWSDGTTMWVLDSVDRKAYAYTLATGARDADKDFNLDPDNRDSLGIWSNETTAWVSDKVDGKLYAYTLADDTRDTSKEFALTANSHPHDVSGIWSDGTTMWVGDIDSGSPKLVAYTLADGNHDAAKDINLHRDRVPHGLWGRAGTIWVADAGLIVLAVPSGLHRVYAYNLPLSSPNDITLSSLSVTPSPRSLSFTPKMRPEFSYGQGSYHIAITNQSTRVTVNAVANNSATPVTYRDGRGAILVDASSSAPGFQVDVGVGETPIVIGLASGGNALTYSVVVERDSAALHGWTPTKDLNNLLDDNPDLAAGQMRGLWADETTLYVTPHNRTTIFAYTRATGARDTTKDITTQYASKAGIWSDGTTMWVLNYGYGENNSGTVVQIGTGKLFAFNLSTGMRDTAKEFALHLTETHSARGIWSDGTTVWVSDYKAAKLFAYTLATGARDADKDITLHSNNDSAQGIWSDGTTIWVAQWNSRKVYAYTLATGAYDPDNDFDRTPENLFSRDIWSDGTTLYVPDVFKKKVYSYNTTGDPVETVIVPPTEPIASDYDTWVDNRQGDATTEYANTGTYRLAQGFRTGDTGDTVGIYEVHEIHVDFYFGQPTGDIKVSIVESTSPDDIWEFATPTDLRKGGEYAPKAVTTGRVHTFARTSGNSALKSNTNYFLVIESSNDDAAEAAVVRMTPDDGEASNDGWTVDDFSHSQAKRPDATWIREQHQVRFRMSGRYREGISMAGDSYAFESCPEVRRGEATGCTILIVADEPADPSDPASWPKDVIKSSLVLDPDLFPEITQWWTGWWTRVYETLDFQVSMHPLPTGTDYVTLSYRTAEDSARDPVDFLGAQGSLRFDANGPHSHTVSLRIRDDSEEDSGEYMRFSIDNCKDQSNNSCDHLFVDDRVRGIIYNTEESKEIAYLTVSDVTATEGEGATARFTVSLTSPVTAGVSFEYTTEDGTAKDGTDYTGGSGTAFIGNGDTSVTISVDIANDDTWTGDRSFTLKISDAVYAAISDDTGKATIRDDDPQPLTASFTNLPSGHNGESAFKFNISFNQDVATKYLVMQNDAMTVTNGAITGAERVNGARDFWKITIEPVDGRDVTVELPVTTDCSATGAVCTGGDNPQPLSNSITHTFPGTKLNAGFEGFDFYHDGSTPMQFRLVFSKEVDTTAAEIKDHALTVTGATITTVAQKDEGSTRRWNVTVTPAGTGPIDVILAAATDCAQDGHICTPDGELLARGDWKRSSGPPVISVADAAVTEGDEAQLTFAVTLDRNWSGTVPTVSYATSDGTASADSDYTADSGTLTLQWTRTGSLIRPWTLAGTITVPITDDTLVEGAETLTLTLSSPVWATLGDAVATGTIEDDDTAPEPKADDSAPTGLPTITGTPQADSALTADTSAIDDANGLTGVSYVHQWIVTTDGADADIEGATARTYTPRSAHVGKTLKVRVTFTDDDDYEHTLTSEPTMPVTKPADATVWSADMLVVQYTDISIGAASADLFSNVGGTGDLQIKSLWSYVPDSDLRLAFTDTFGDAEDHTLIVGDLTLEFPAGSSGEQSFKWTNVELGWEDGQTIAVSIVPTTPTEPVANTAATGQPTISGTPQVGQSLTAGTADITDADGLDRVSYNYQWLAGDANIQHATDRTYTPGVNDVGKTIRVKVSFTDDRGNAETLTSIATAAVLATVPTAPQGLTVTQGSQIQELDASWQAPSSNGGSAVTGYKVQWKEAADSWDTAADVSQATETGTTHTITGLTGGVEYAVRVMATNDEGDSPASTEAKGTPAAENNAPTGLPGISGTAQVGETLTASTSNIDDEDGLDNVSYRYQWVRNDGTDDAEIAGETSSTYTLVDADQGQTIRVKVAFTDDAGNDESLTSAATGTVLARPNRPAAGLPTISGTPQVEQTLTADTSSITDEDGLTNVSYAYQWSAGGTDIDGATGSTYTLTASEQGQTIQVQATFTDDADNEETLTSQATVAVAAASNREATGQPAIGGTPQVGKTLTADTAGITDADGLTNVSYEYQWLASGTDIDGATGPSYVLTSSEQGQTIQVRVTFTDDADNDESLTSAATETVLARPNRAAAGLPTISGTPQVDQTLTADTSAISDEDGLTNVSWSYQWTAGGTDIKGATSSTHTLVFADQGKTIKVKVSFTDDRGSNESLTSVATVAVAAAPNREATGAPSIGGTPQVDQTLTADTSPIADEDGLENVSYSYQWTAGGTDIDGATGASYTLTADEEGLAIQVRVSFEDDADNQETLTSEATLAVAPKPTPLTATFSNMPDSHDGSTEFTFDLTFSENFPLSYKTLRDHAFTEDDNGPITRAQRKVQGSNLAWTITVEPKGNGAITITLPETTDCNADGAICTDDGRKLSNSTTITVPGPQ